MTGNWSPALSEGEQPSEAPLPTIFEPLVETARTYARAARSRSTRRAYAADWRDYLRWRSRQGLDLRPLADPECVGLYLAALASGTWGLGYPRAREPSRPRSSTTQVVGHEVTSEHLNGRHVATSSSARRSPQACAAIFPNLSAGHIRRALAARRARLAGRDRRTLRPERLDYASAEMTSRYQRGATAFVSISPGRRGCDRGNGPHLPGPLPYWV